MVGSKSAANGRGHVRPLAADARKEIAHGLQAGTAEQRHGGLWPGRGDLYANNEWETVVRRAGLGQAWQPARRPIGDPEFGTSSTLTPTHAGTLRRTTWGVAHGFAATEVRLLARPEPPADGRSPADSESGRLTPLLFPRELSRPPRRVARRRLRLPITLQKGSCGARRHGDPLEVVHGPARRPISRARVGRV
jgi:hypothetical protein